MSDRAGHAVVIPAALVDEMVVHCLAALPLEGCGLLVGHAETREVIRVVPTANEAGSSRLYTVGSADFFRADRAAERDGLAIVDAYPSPTDIAQAPDPTWHYVLVSLRDEVASVRSFAIERGVVLEEPIVERVPGP